MESSLCGILPLHRQDCVSLGQILHLFSAPITEEQAWAMIHQAVFCLHELHTQTDLFLIQKPEEFVISREGLVHPDTFTRPHTKRPVMSSYISAVVEIGSVVYCALDYGVAEDEERTLSPGLANLINMMVSQHSSEEEEVSIVVTGSDYRDIVPNSGHLLKTHLFCSDYRDILENY